MIRFLELTIRFLTKRYDSIGDNTMTTKNSARKSFATNVAPKLSAPVTEPMVTLPGGGTMSISAYMAAFGAATSATPAVKPTSRKAPPPVVAPVGAPVSAPIDFVAKAKETECFKAARQACRDAGLAYDAKSNPTGGKFGPNREAYWTAFWAGFNAKATEIGIPVRNRPAK